MDDVFLRLEEELRAGRPAALLTVVESHGATPRGAGSRQLVLTSGDTVGTIGGGIGEYKACEAARQALQDGVSTLLAYDLSPGAAADMGAVCGGTVTVFCQYIGPDAAACIGAMVESGRWPFPGRKRYTAAMDDMRRICSVFYRIVEKILHISRS